MLIDMTGKTSRGFEPRLLDSESRVLTATPQGQLKATRSPQYLPSNLQRKQHWQSRRRRHRRHRSSIRILCERIRIGFQVRFWAPPPLSTRGGAWLRDNAVCAYLTLQKPCTETQTVWPSGLRRWLQAPVRKGVGSNPTAVSRACLSPAPTRCLGGAWLRDDAVRGGVRTLEFAKKNNLAQTDRQFGRVV